MKNGSFDHPCHFKLARRVRKTVDTEMSNPDLYITESCVPVLWNCSAGKQLIDPCSCFQYYECRGHGNGVVERKCALGTAYNHDSKNCVNDLDVLRTQCPRNDPWDRCGLNGTQTEILKQRCTNSTTTVTTTTSNPVTKAGTNGSDGNEVGIILGGLFGGLFVVVVAILIAVLFQRHRAKTKSKLTKKRSVQNPEYNIQPEPSLQPPQEDEEETYHVIDDNMNDPTYNSDSITVKPPSLPNRTSAGDTIGGSEKMGIVNNNFQLHNSDTLTSQHEPINFHAGTGYIHGNGKAAGVSDEPETSNYITIFPHENPEDRNETTPDVFEETPYDNSLVSRSNATGEDTKF